MPHFIKDVCRAMECIAPLRLAESWDNVGLLLEAQPLESSQNKILLTIDVTPIAVREAIKSQASIVVAYNPPIFRPLTSLTSSDPMQRSLLRLVQAGISVYSPHTALISAKGGINDWIAEALLPGQDQPNGVDEKKPNGKTSKELVSTKRPSKLPKDDDKDTGGVSRLLTLPSPGLKITEIIEKVKRHLGVYQVHVARPFEKDGWNIRKVAVSAGCRFDGISADLYITAEMAYDEILAMKARNRFVMLLGPSKAEEGYLRVLRKKVLDKWEETPDLTHLDSVHVCTENKIMVPY